MFIYVIVNSATGKLYVGQHKGDNLKKYLQDKISHAHNKRVGRSRLAASMRKHSKKVWSIHPLISDVQTRPELDEYEKMLIKALKSQHPDVGYNICKGGEGFSGPHAPESKAKVTKALKKRWKQPGFKKHWSEMMAGHPVSEETVEKIKIARAEQDEFARAAGCRKYAEEHPEEMSTRMSHEVHVLGGKAGSKEDKRRAGLLGAKLGGEKARHTRWHVMRGKPSPECPLCDS